MVEFNDLKPGMIVFDPNTAVTRWYLYVLKIVPIMGVAVWGLIENKRSGKIEIGPYAYTQDIWDDKEKSQWEEAGGSAILAVMKKMVEAVFVNCEL
jgi:hypothetical protein